jgi:REP element-mobilizing transposase RayT
MAATLVQLYVHFIFSTKEREPLLPACFDEELYAYVGGVIKTEGGIPIAVNGTADHIHILATLPKTVSVADYVRTIKANSSRWLKTKEGISNAFAWQNGYGAFSVSESMKDRVVNYIANQKEHHRNVSFQEEFLQFLKRHNVPYDERYVWT